MVQSVAQGRGDEVESFHRHWTLLSKIPREPGQVDAGTLESALEAEGIQVSRRTIQRDLEKLARVFPGLVKNDKSRPYGWKWSRMAPSFLVPKMNLESAVTLELVAQNLATMLPRASTKALRGVFEQAHEAIAHGQTSPMAQWPKKVRSLPRGYPRQAPDVDERILDAVYEGLLYERVLHVTYQKYGAPRPRDYVVHPLGLVERSGVLNLVCTLNDHSDAVHIVLHRIEGAEVQQSKRKRPRGFRLDEYVASGSLGFLVGDRIKLRARVSDALAQSFVECPLGEDQRLTSDAPGWEKLSVSVNDSSELRGWIRSLGALMEVLGPKSLREAIAAELRDAAGYYR